MEILNKVKKILESQERLLYHGTNKDFDSFDIEKEYRSRNEKLGAGKAIYLSPSKEVAKKYAEANANASFNKVIIQELKEKNELAAELLELIYIQGYEKGWDVFLEKYGYAGVDKMEEEGYNPNDVSTLAPYIRGTKDVETEEPTNFFNTTTSAEMPEGIINIAKSLGIKSIPVEPKILTVRLKPQAKLKEIGFTEDLKREVEQAKQERYDALEFISDNSVDGIEEIAVFNPKIIVTIN